MSDADTLTRMLKITELTLQVFYQEGNPDLPATATQRAAASPRAPRP